MSSVVDHPVLIPVGEDPLGGMITAPASAPPRAGLVLLPEGGNRSGANRMWADLARTLAQRGVSVLRPDYPGFRDSTRIDPSSPQGARALREALAWFRDRIETPDLLLLGSCRGARHGVVLGASAPGDLRGIGLVVPYLRRPPELGRLLRLVRRVWRGVRPPHFRPGDRPRIRTGVDADLQELLSSIAGRTPVWVLVGEHDYAATDVAALPVGLELETIPGVALHTFGDPGMQREAAGRIVRWVERRLDDRGATTTGTEASRVPRDDAR